MSEEVGRLAASGQRPPCLAVVLVGDDPASASYIKGKRRACKRVGIESMEHDLPAEAVGLEIRPENASMVIDIGRRIKAAVNAQLKIQHPEKEFINECTHVEFYGQPSSPEAHLKNTVFFAESGIDRSPCGTGTSAKLAVLHAKGELKLNQEFVHESIIGSIYFVLAGASIVDMTAHVFSQYRIAKLYLIGLDRYPFVTYGLILGAIL